MMGELEGTPHSDNGGVESVRIMKLEAVNQEAEVLREPAGSCWTCLLLCSSIRDSVTYLPHVTRHLPPT